MSRTRWVAVAALGAAMTLSSCSSEVIPTRELLETVDAYSDAVASAFVLPAAEGRALEPLVVKGRERDLVARANLLVGPYASKWENAAAIVTDLQCSGRADDVECQYVVHVGLSAPNDTADIVFHHRTHLIRADDGTWRVDQDEVSS